MIGSVRFAGGRLLRNIDLSQQVPDLVDLNEHFLDPLGRYQIGGSPEGLEQALQSMGVVGDPGLGHHSGRAFEGVGVPEQPTHQGNRRFTAAQAGQAARELVDQLAGLDPEVPVGIRHLAQLLATGSTS
jgi:hypothetical protein